MTTTRKNLALAVTLFSLHLSATAQETSHNDAGGDWRFTVNFPMIWAPDISGEFEVNDVKTDIDIPFSDILDSLSMGYIGEFYVEKGNWGAAFRTMYLETENESTTNAIGLPGQPPLLAKHRLTVESALYTADLVGFYRVHRNVRLLAGGRKTGTDIELRIKPLEEGGRKIKGKQSVADEDMVDWIAGLDLNFKLSKSWSATLQADTAFAGDNDTDWQVNAFFSYRISELNNVWFGYRYLEIGNDDKSGQDRVKTSFTQQGPTLGWAFTF